MRCCDRAQVHWARNRGIVRISVSEAEQDTRYAAKPRIMLLICPLGLSVDTFNNAAEQLMRSGSRSGHCCKTLIASVDAYALPSDARSTVLSSGTHPSLNLFTVAFHIFQNHPVRWQHVENTYTMDCLFYTCGHRRVVCAAVPTKC